MKSKNKNQKGITLVALIITIIVLLILAVVAIRAVTGDGIIAHAKNARTQYEEKAAEENGTIQNYADYITGQIGGSSGGSEDSNVASYVEEVPIPKGFTHVAGTTKATGLVITDNNPDGASEFVWIPVNNINDMVMCQTHGANSTDENGEEIKLDQTTLQCPECGENTKLAGKLYATSTGENFNADLTGQTYTAGSGLREPDVVTDSSKYDAVESNLERVLEGEYATTKTAASFKAQLESRFTLMAKSVAKYKGFYVGRYEMSLNASGNAQSKAGESPATAATTSADKWYGLYTKGKTYAPENSTKSVVSEMIWGCQWDAMMKFILDTPDESHVTATDNVGRDTKFRSKPYETGGTNYSEVYTGDTEYNDIAANIYDLEGNVREWTQEAWYGHSRVLRGGFCNGGGSPSCCGNDWPTGTSGLFRFPCLTLYQVILNAKGDVT